MRESYSFGKVKQVWRTLLVISMSSQKTVGSLTADMQPSSIVLWSTQ